MILMFDIYGESLCMVLENQSICRNILTLKVILMMCHVNIPYACAGASLLRSDHDVDTSKSIEK